MSGFVDSFKRGKTFEPQEENKIVNLPIVNIQSDSNQVRKHFDESRIDELAISIKAKGIQNPIHVRQVSTDQWIIITGERRFRAAQKVGLDSVPAICHPSTITDQETRILQMIENLQREDLTTMEIVRGFQSMSAIGMERSAIIEMVGTPKATVSKIFSIIKEISEDWLKIFEEICYKRQNIPMSRLYEISKEENTNRKNAMYSALLQEYKYQSGEVKIEEEKPQENEAGKEEKKSKKERFDSEVVWECLKKVAKKDREEILKYIPTSKLEKLLEDYGTD